MYVCMYVFMYVISNICKIIPSSFSRIVKNVRSPKENY